MKKALILHSIDNVKDCLRQRFEQDYALFTTHSSVEVYLDKHYGIKCPVLSRYFLDDEVKLWLEDIDVTVTRLLAQCDQEITGELNTYLGCQINWFQPIYSYLGKHQYLVYKSIVASVDRIQQEFGFTQVCFYNAALDSFYKTKYDLKDFVAQYYGQATGVRVIPGGTQLPTMLKGWGGIWNKIRNNPGLVFERVREKIVAKTLANILDDKKTNVLLFHNLYDMSFLAQTLRGEYNLIEYDARGNLITPFEQTEDPQESFCNNFVSIEERGKNALEKIFLRDVMTDFKANINRYLASLRRLACIHRKYPIRLAIWGNPPIKQFKALAFEYLRKMGVHVIGAQHGSVHGVQRKIWQMDSDFNRCKSFISYGFSGNDLSRVYNATNIDTKICPFGKIRKGKPEKVRQSIDILFPITNSISLLTAGMARTFPHELTERQLRILEYLESSKTQNIYIKPFTNANYETCSVMPVLNGLKHAKVNARFSLTEFLECYEPKIVIIEFPSTPLYEVMEEGSEIFLIGDSILDFETVALEELRKGVHFFDNVTDLLDELDKYLVGQFAQKKDRTFYRHYLGRPNAKESILKYIVEVTQDVQLVP